MKSLPFFDHLALVLLIVGGLNWGLVGLFGFNLVSALLGEGLFASLVYILVGFAAAYEAWRKTMVYLHVHPHPAH